MKPALVFLVLLSMLGCGQGAAPEARALLIGLDGIEMNVLVPLLEQGKLPNLARLIDSGVLGYLQTFVPTYSPVVWTSIATGKLPEEHQIRGFLEPKTGLAYTSNTRNGKAIWNIVSDYGLKCNVTGYWITWPAEPINGRMVSQTTCREQVNDIWKGMLYEEVDDSTHPPGFIKELWPEIERFQKPEFVDSELLPKIFNGLGTLDFSGDLPRSKLEVMKLIKDSKWSLAGDFLYFEAAKYLLDKYPGDLDIVYLGGTDVIAHRFWRYKDPKIFSYSIPDEFIRVFEDAIDNYYIMADEMIGELLSKVPENTRVFILSDHGMHPSFLDGTDSGKPTILSAHHLDGPAGVIIASGEGIRQGPGLRSYLATKKFKHLGSVLDVAPTLLYLMDIPVGEDMKHGKVMDKVVDRRFFESRSVELIDTHDKEFRRPSAPKITSENNEAFVKTFQELGYL